MFSMEMGRRVVVEKHADDDTEERADDRHVLDRTRFSPTFDPAGFRSDALDA